MGMFSVAKACMMLPIHRRFIGCEIDVVHFNASLPSVVKTFPFQVLKDDMGIKCSAKTVTAAWIYVYAMDGTQVRSKRVIWDELADDLRPSRSWGMLFTSCQTFSKTQVCLRWEGS